MTFLDKRPLDSQAIKKLQQEVVALGKRADKIEKAQVDKGYAGIIAAIKSVEKAIREGGGGGGGNDAATQAKIDALEQLVKTNTEEIAGATKP